MEAGEVSCSVTVEALDSNGVVTRRKTYRNVRMLLGRDEFEDIILKIDSQRSPLGKSYRLREVNIHKRFLKDGKATIKLITQKMQLLLSNCPPNQLAAFLKCIALKLAKQKASGFTSERKRLMSEKPRSFEYISPLTHKDLPESQKLEPFGRKRPREAEDVDQSSTTPKRIKTNVEGGGPLRKRLNVLSCFQSELTKEQLAVVKAVRANRNVFFTGSAGTGKSHLLKRLIGMLPPHNTFVTASTGVAASHISGTTLHAFAGIGTGSAPLEQCVELASRPGRVEHWKRCQHLIIDEISMVDGEFFDKLEVVARSIKKNEKPFGGIHLILSGDFLQLPPVAKYTEKKKFAFQATSWSDCISSTTELVQVHRQKDPMFISILQNIRVGSCPTKLVDCLTATKNQQIEKDGIQATKLCTHKENVNQINSMQLEQLQSKMRTFHASDSDPSLTQTLNKQLPVDEKLDLKVGAQVMLTKNLDVSKGLVNGARGVILGFESGNPGYPMVKFKSGIKKVLGPEKWVVRTGGGGTVTRKQLPLRLAWAVSIHKSQGMTLDCVEISLSRVFEYGQAYVALSRARSLQGLRVLDFDPKSVCAHPDVLRFYAKLRRESKMAAASLHKLGDADKENHCLY